MKKLSGLGLCLVLALSVFCAIGATPVVHGHEDQRFANGSAAATAAITLTLATPPTGQRVVIDTISESYVGTVQTSEPVLVRVAGAGATRWQLDVTSATTGFGMAHYGFSGGLKLATDESIEVFCAAMANCAQKADCTYHFES